MLDVKSARQVVDDAYEALFGRGDLDGFLTDFDDNSQLIEAESLPYAGVFRGKDGIKAAIQNVFNYWKDFSYEIESVVYGDEYVIAYGQFSATGSKSNKKVSFPLAEVWKIKNGRVALVHPVYGDTKQAVDALS